jgi:GNAT superfamily N-acetyltransferase
MSRLELRERHFDSFFDAPFRVYGERYPFVSQLKGDLRDALSEKNPLLKVADLTYYTALRGGRPVGRIVAHVHRAANERFNERTASFGFFDCADDVEVGRSLLSAAETFGRARGCDRIRGNMNLTANQEIGVLVEGEERRPYLAQIYNPAYIAQILETCGYERTKPMTSFVKSGVAETDASWMLEDRHRELLLDPAYRFRPFDLRRFDEEVESLRQVLNAAMDKNYLFVPMTREEARFQLGPLERVMDPELTRIAEHNGRVVGVALGVPDVVPLLQSMKGRLFPLGWWKFLTGRKRIRSATLVIILALPEYHSKGLMRILTSQLIQSARDRGYDSVGATWIGDDNVASLKAVHALGMKPYHRLFMYEKEL